MTGSALLLMDFQEGICGPEGALGTASGLSAHTAERGVLPALARCLAGVRAAGLPVLHARVAFDPAYTRRTNRSGRFASFEEKGLMLEGSPESEFVREARPLDGETVVQKGCVNPFIGTILSARLSALGISHLYLAGVATNFVVESAARHAGDSGVQVTVLEDLCASYNQEMHDFAIKKTLPLFARIDTSASLLSGLASDQTDS
ncbi:MAG: cysteine hydrolase [Actinomycetota bacterium]|nr:cysteine hydrolase [Actinomycetota bacterium]